LLPNGGDERGVVMPPDGSQWSPPANVKISMIPSQNVGMAKPM